MNGARSRIAASARSNGTRPPTKSYLEEGVRILELARNAQRLFERQEPREKRRSLNFLVSNCSWKGGELTVNLRQPFDLLAETTLALEKGKAVGGNANGLSQIGRGNQDQGLTGSLYQLSYRGSERPSARAQPLEGGSGIEPPYEDLQPWLGIIPAHLEKPFCQIFQPRRRYLPIPNRSCFSRLFCA